MSKSQSVTSDVLGTDLYSQGSLAGSNIYHPSANCTAMKVLRETEAPFGKHKPWTFSVGPQAVLRRLCLGPSSRCLVPIQNHKNTSGLSGASSTKTLTLWTYAVSGYLWFARVVSLYCKSLHPLSLQDPGPGLLLCGDC